MITKEELREKYETETGKKHGNALFSTTDYACWLEKRIVKNCSIPDVWLSLPDEEEINSMRLEMDCPTPNEEEYTTAGFKSGVRWLKNTIERQLQGQ